MTDAEKGSKGTKAVRFAKGLLVAPAVALAAGFGVTLAARLGGFTGSVGTYHAALLAAFWALYYFIPGGFERHFNVPGPVGAADVAYFTAITHVTVGYGDVYPKTTGARLLVMTHVLLAFVVMANIVPIGSTVFSYSTFVGGD